MIACWHLRQPATNHPFANYQKMALFCPSAKFPPLNKQNIIIIHNDHGCQWNFRNDLVGPQKQGRRGELCQAEGLPAVSVPVLVQVQPFLEVEADRGETLNDRPVDINSFRAHVVGWCTCESGCANSTMRQICRLYLTTKV